MAGQLSNPGYHDLKDHISCQEIGTQSSFKCILMNNKQKSSQAKCQKTIPTKVRPVFNTWGRGELMKKN